MPIISSHVGFSRRVHPCLLISSPPFSSCQFFTPPPLSALHHSSLQGLRDESLFLFGRCLSPPPVSSSSSAPLVTFSAAPFLALPQLLLTNIRIHMICLLHDSFIHLPALCSFNLEH